MEREAVCVAGDLEYVRGGGDGGLSDEGGFMTSAMLVLPQD